MSSEQDRTEVDRRRLLAAGAAAVGGLALVDAVAADAPGKQVEDRGLVVWYDPEQTFVLAAAELAIPKTTVARYDGSFFRLRHEIDHLMNGDLPPRLIVIGTERPSRQRAYAQNIEVVSGYDIAVDIVRLPVDCHRHVRLVIGEHAREGVIPVPKLFECRIRKAAPHQDQFLWIFHRQRPEKEGINEAGAFSSWIAAASQRAKTQLPIIYTVDDFVLIRLHGRSAGTISVSVTGRERVGRSMSPSAATRGS